jgi:hypothetical protein
MSTRRWQDRFSVRKARWCYHWVELALPVAALSVELEELALLALSWLRQIDFGALPCSFGALVQVVECFVGPAKGLLVEM